LLADADASSTSNPIFLNLLDTDRVDVSKCSAADATVPWDIGLSLPTKSVKD
jgi:hypothetical protein